MNNERRQLAYSHVKTYVERFWTRRQLRWGPANPPELERQDDIRKDVALLRSVAWQPLSRPLSRVWAEGTDAGSPPVLLRCQDEGTVNAPLIWQQFIRWGYCQDFSHMTISHLRVAHVDVDAGNMVYNTVTYHRSTLFSSHQKIICYLYLHMLMMCIIQHT